MREKLLLLLHKILMNFMQELVLKMWYNFMGVCLKPHAVWFGEGLEQNVLNSAEQAVDECDLCMVVTTSSVVYPAAMFAPSVASRGVTVTEFNLEDMPATMQFKYHFCGPAGTFVPQALDP